MNEKMKEVHQLKLLLYILWKQFEERLVSMNLDDLLPYLVQGSGMLRMPFTVEFSDQPLKGFASISFEVLREQRESTKKQTSSLTWEEENLPQPQQMPKPILPELRKIRES